MRRQGHSCMSRQLPPGRYTASDLRPGDWIACGTARITTREIAEFAEISGDRFEIHLSDTAARARGYPGQVAHGLLVMARVEGLVAEIAEAAGRPLPSEGLRERVAEMTAGGIARAEADLVPHDVGAAPPGAVVLSCARGGLRSRSVVALLRAIGLEGAVGLEGGYRAVRKDAIDELERFEPPARVVVLRGLTGVGKTLLLHRLETLRPGSTLDLEALAAQLDGSERMVIFCSPHNPGGRVWSREEIRALAAFCAEHDLILVSDEIHGDLVLPGGPRHLIANLAAPEHADRIVTLLAGTKTFNLAGAMTGGVFVQDEALRKRFAAHQMRVGATPNGMGLTMIEAAYRGGEAWLDDLLIYLGGNRKVFDDGIAAIPGLRSMPLEATYLGWVDFSGTGMTREEFTQRVEREAKIAVNHGPPFGSGGESWLRFNFATPRSRVQEAVERLAKAFGDLQ